MRNIVFNIVVTGGIMSWVILIWFFFGDALKRILRRNVQAEAEVFEMDRYRKAG